MVATEATVVEDMVEVDKVMEMVVVVVEDMVEEDTVAAVVAAVVMTTITMAVEALVVSFHLVLVVFGRPLFPWL